MPQIRPLVVSAGPEDDGAQLPLSAAVLAGGQSRRMGADKAFLPIVDGGAPMLSIVLERLRTLSDDVTIIANGRERFEPFGARVTPDLHPETGALGGIHAAVSQAKHDHCLVVACDMPFLNIELLHWMSRQRRNYDVLVPSIPGESSQGGDGVVFQTLHAIYGKGCLPAIEARLKRGDRRVVGFFPEVRVRTIDANDVMLRDPALRSFFNANTPAALATAGEMIARG